MRVRSKGVRTTLQKTRTLLSVGIALSLAATSFAGSRSRTTEGRDQVRTAGVPQSVTTEAPRWQVVAPGVVRAEIGGYQLEFNADGRVVQSDIVASYGTVKGYQMAVSRSAVAGAVAPNGDRLYADGVVPFDRSQLGPNSPKPAPRSLADARRDFAWTQATIGGQDVTVFVNGLTVKEMGVQFDHDIASMTGPGGVDLYVNGMAFKP